MNKFKEEFEGNFEIDDQKLKAVRKGIVVILGCALLGFAGMMSVYTLGEQEQAVVTTFGKAEAVTTPGLHFKIPFVQKVEKISKEIMGLSIGYDIADNTSIERESLMITEDFNFVITDFYIEYVVVDPVKALYNSEEPIVILKNLSQSYIRDTIGTYTVDEVLTTKKGEIQATIKEKLINRVEKDDLGIQVVNVTIQDAEPPTSEVFAAFKEVETAKQGKETAINNANKYESEQMPAARAQADSIVKKATAEKEARVNEATGQANRFNSMYTEYQNFPFTTKERMLYETLQKLAPNMEIIINATGNSTIVIPSDALGGKNE